MGFRAWVRLIIGKAPVDSETQPESGISPYLIWRDRELTHLEYLMERGITQEIYEWESRLMAQAQGQNPYCRGFSMIGNPYAPLMQSRYETASTIFTRQLFGSCPYCGRPY